VEIRAIRVIRVLFHADAHIPLRPARSRTHAIAGGQREVDGGNGGEDAGGVPRKGFIYYDSLYLNCKDNNDPESKK